MIKLCILSSMLVLFTAGTSLAQGTREEPPPDPDRGSFFLGPIATLSQAYQVGTLAAGWQSTPRFSWSGGADAHYLVSEGLGIDLTVAYDTRGLYLADSTNRTSFTATYKYLSLRPEVNFGSFLVGLGFGIPLGSSAQRSDLYTQDITGDASDMKLLIEARVGLSIPVYKHDDGELRLLLEGTYGFTKISKTTVGGPDNSVNNGPLASIGVGLAYLFSLTPPQ